MGNELEVFTPGMVKALRRRLGWSQSELGKKIGQSQEYISRCESGHVDWIRHTPRAKLIALRRQMDKQEKADG